MPKLAYGLIPALLAVFLAACQGAAPIEPTPIPASPTPVPATATTVAAATTAPGCSVVSDTLPREAPPDSPFPAVSAEDWSLGPEQPAVTFIEYGDFQ